MMTSGSSRRLKRRGGLEMPFPHLADRRVGDVADVALAPLELGDLHGVDVEPQDRDSSVGEGPGQRQADIAQPDDPDPDGARLDLGEKPRMQGKGHIARRRTRGSIHLAHFLFALRQSRIRTGTGPTR